MTLMLQVIIWLTSIVISARTIKNCILGSVKNMKCTFCFFTGGQTVVKFNRIPPKTNNSHVLVVRPKKFGYFNFTSAEVRYKSGEEGGVTKIGFSSDPGQGLIIALKDYERQFSAHMVSRILSLQ